MRTKLLRLLDEYPNYAVRIGQALLIVAVIVSVLSFTFVSPAQYSEQVTVEKGMVEHSINTQATVVEETSVYSPGDTVRNSPLYSVDTMSNPIVQVNATKYPEGTENINHQMVLKIEGKYQGTSYNKYQTVLTKSTNKTAAIQMNISEIESAARNIHNLYNQTGTVYASLHIHTTYEYKGKNITVTSEMPLQITSGEIYSIGTGATTSEQSYDFFEQRTTTSQLESATPYLGLSTILALLGGGLLIGRRFFVNQSRTESDYLRHKHSEWITPVPEYTVSDEKDVVETESMLKLIELAIDMNNRVIYDSSTDTFIVETELKKFVFEP